MIDDQKKTWVELKIVKILNKKKTALTKYEESIEKFVINIAKTFEDIALAEKIHVANKTANNLRCVSLRDWVNQICKSCIV